MKTEVQSKEIKNFELNMNSESNPQLIENMVEKTSAASMTQPTTNDNQIDNAAKKASNSKEEIITLEDSTDVSSSEPRSSEIEDDISSTETLPHAEEEIITLEDSTDVSSSEPRSSENEDDISSEETLPHAEAPTTNMKIEDNESHRKIVQYSSESSDFESESDESSDDEFLTKMRQSALSLPAKVPAEVVKTKGELLIVDLPPVEDLHISVEPTELQKIGHILHILESEFLVVIESNGTANPLNEDSVLFLGSGEPLGKIHEPYGSVNRPNYVVRFNTLEDMHNKGLKVGQDVYYSPENDEFTSYVLVDALRQQKGSDASWKDNNEPPVELIDYSDDEQEMQSNRKRRARNRKNDRTWDSEEHVTPKRKESEPVNDNHERTSRANPSRNKFRSPTVPPTRSTSQSQAPTLPPIIHFSQSRAPTPPTFGHFSQSQGPSPHSFGHFSALRSPGPPQPYRPPHTPPPPLQIQQSFAIPPVLPSQTPPPTVHPLVLVPGNYTLPVQRNPLHPPNYPHS